MILKIFSLPTITFITLWLSYGHNMRSCAGAKLDREQSNQLVNQDSAMEHF